MTTLTFRLFHFLNRTQTRASQTKATPRAVPRRDSHVGAWVPLMLWASLKTTGDAK